MRQSYQDKLKKIVRDKLRLKFRDSAISLIIDASNNTKHGDLTGNTITSFSAGLYYDGVLDEVLNVMDFSSLDHPEYRKLQNSDGVVSLNRYDNGVLVTVNASNYIDTDGSFGWEYARSFLESYRPKFTKGWSIVVTTGTEYSSYIEEVRHLNVLTETYLWSDNVLSGIFR